ncbi:unnamed protein product [Closterium sp. NIES-64]|nr:unnamed protein product [Closterium sp. NIES-64]CAI6005521.1 unnamed protein product [Closterium sp. NIES-65]
MAAQCALSTQQFSIVSSVHGSTTKASRLSPSPRTAVSCCSRKAALSSSSLSSRRLTALDCIQQHSPSHTLLATPARVAQHIARRAVTVRARGGRGPSSRQGGSRWRQDEPPRRNSGDSSSGSRNDNGWMDLGGSRRDANLPWESDLTGRDRITRRDDVWGGRGVGEEPQSNDRGGDSSWGSVGGSGGAQERKGWSSFLPSSFFQPRRAAETDSLPADVRDQAIKGVEQAGRSGARSSSSAGGREKGVRVTVGDVAAASGLKVTEAEKALKALAADAEGFLEVSDEGDVVYVLPSNLSAAVAQRSLWLKLKPWIDNAKSAASYVVRVAFGTALLASILIVYTAISVLLSSRSDSDSRDSRGGGGGEGGMYYRSGPTFFFNPMDIFWYWDPFYYQRMRASLQTREMSFFESVFSFVFGDGDPNDGRDEARWQLVGDVIASRGGVVAAQEIAPYLDLPADTSDESFMLPVLQRFDGSPEVDPQGNILYTFPLLQRTAGDLAGKQRKQPSPALDPVQQTRYFAENLWTFSEAPAWKRTLAAGLGVVNVVGVVWLSSLLSDPAIVREAGVEFVQLISSLMPWLQGYAAVFFAIPAVRYLWLQRANETIALRNSRRQQSALQLAQPNAQLRRKLANAREQARSMVVSEDKVIYTTAKDVAEQDLEAREWERKLEGR